MLKIDIQDRQGVTLIRCSGRVVHHDGADALQWVVLSQENTQIVIDVSGVRAIDAAGLGALVAIQRWANGSGRTVQLLNPGERVRELLRSTRLDSVLEIREESTVTGMTA